jgi:hypothetical protein
MTWTPDKHIAAILNGIDPRVARALEELLAAGLIVQDGERPNDSGVMLPAYRLTDVCRALLADPSKLDEVLDALDERKNDPSQGTKP